MHACMHIALVYCKPFASRVKTRALECDICKKRLLVPFSSTFTEALQAKDKRRLVWLHPSFPLIYLLSLVTPFASFGNKQHGVCVLHEPSSENTAGAVRAVDLRRLVHFWGVHVTVGMTKKDVSTVLP